ncbi:transcription termination factor Rho [Nakamurella endophytica]|uniref:Transcription termination factor Rho n=1 Tax=Nakamurella endophytica TaxID=1748367 RepID=A0A917WP49_9ACTN|nr:transcription termination factor Rho [Nakamurella endophytica]GGM18111.1 hypothetical protein GCM10011594_42730 [Nakamurella endophytica]
MSNTTEQPGATLTATRRRGDGLAGMVLPELKALAAQLGIKGASGLRKGDLVAAITARQNGSSGAAAATNGTHHTPAAATEQAVAAPAPAGERAGDGERPADAAERPARRAASGRDSATEGRPAGSADDHRAADHRADDHRAADAAPSRPAGTDGAAAGTAGTTGTATTGGDAAPTGAAGLDGAPPTDDRRDRGEQDGRADVDGRSAQDRDGRQDGEEGGRSRRNRRNRRDRADRADRADRGEQTNGAATAGTVTAGTDGATADTAAPAEADRESRRDGQGQNGQPQQGQNRRDRQDRQDRQGQDRQQDRQDRNDLDDDGPGGRRGRRFRERNRRGRERFTDTPDTEVREDDVLVPVAGIVDVLDSYAFVRTSGYLSGSNDVYVSLSQVRKYGLRRGDAVTGAVRAPREGEAQRQKFNALVRLDSINGVDPETLRHRPEFTKLTPLYPNERLRLETESHLLTTRVIDLVMPVGKGQRALIVSPPKAGKTMVMQAIANAITTNNPECHLMVVLVDERPEEVTDMQRSVRGEVIASTFDRPPADHTMVAELSIERAKRLVEMGKDVVVLLDSITRLGRAYNLAAPASGRILSGGVDSTALFPPKRFLGAARNIENGGSLTIFASALVETGSAGDTVIFEEFKGTGNAELKLDRKLADKRIFPAIDVDQSSTRKEDLLLSPDELAIVVKLRRVLAALDSQQALELVLDRLRKTRNNVEFLMQVAKTTPGGDRD